ncbi:MAG: prolipoprotein diacylglyceryl transferase [Planctomycetes bacterium]|nr:prolipoprotein diacylglyceryl transferase [Planctomycetota bacterium]
MFPILFQIGDFKLHAFGVMVALGFLGGLWFATKEARRTGLVSEEVVNDLFLWLIAGGIIGARLLYCAIHWEKDFADEPLRVLQIWKGGIVSVGGFFGAFFFGWIFCKKNKVSFLDLADVCMPGALLGQAIGRIGCFLVGDDYGRPAPDLPWAVTFPKNPDSLLPERWQGVALHPTQLYMLIKAFLIFLVLAWVARRRRFAGQVLYVAMMLYPIGRWICEIYRGDEAERGIWYGLSTAQWTLMPVFLLGLIQYVRGSRRG